MTWTQLIIISLIKYSWASHRDENTYRININNTIGTRIKKKDKLFFYVYIIPCILLKWDLSMSPLFAFLGHNGHWNTVCFPVSKYPVNLFPSCLSIVSGVNGRPKIKISLANIKGTLKKKITHLQLLLTKLKLSWYFKRNSMYLKRVRLNEIISIRSKTSE